MSAKAGALLYLCSRGETLHARSNAGLSRANIFRFDLSGARCSLVAPDAHDSGSFDCIQSFGLVQQFVAHEPRDPFATPLVLRGPLN